MRNRCSVMAVFIGMFVSSGCGDLWIEGEIWHDQDTGYEWQNPASNDKYKWSEAKEHCEDLEWAGHSDWRLPNKEELKTIWTESKNDGCFWKVGLYGPCTWYWSSSPVESSEYHACSVAFYHDYVNYDNKDDFYHARCMR